VGLEDDVEGELELLPKAQRVERSLEGDIYRPVTKVHQTVSYLLGLRTVERNCLQFLDNRNFKREANLI
jgi:hypothetical protein